MGCASATHKWRLRLVVNARLDKVYIGTNLCSATIVLTELRGNLPTVVGK